MAFSFFLSKQAGKARREDREEERRDEEGEGGKYRMKARGREGEKEAHKKGRERVELAAATQRFCCVSRFWAFSLKGLGMI